MKIYRKKTNRYTGQKPTDRQTHEDIQDKNQQTRRYTGQKPTDRHTYEDIQDKNQRTYVGRYA